MTAVSGLAVARAEIAEVRDVFSPGDGAAPARTARLQGSRCREDRLGWSRRAGGGSHGRYRVVGPDAESQRRGSAIRRMMDGARKRRLRD